MPLPIPVMARKRLSKAFVVSVGKSCRNSISNKRKTLANCSTASALRMP